MGPMEMPTGVGFVGALCCGHLPSLSEELWGPFSVHPFLSFFFFQFFVFVFGVVGVQKMEM